MSSILNDTKHMLGLLPEDTSFDSDVMISVNSALATLHQLGIGPVLGYQIEGPENEWSELFVDPRLNPAKSYVFLRAKREFNPPEVGVVSTSMDRQIQEMEFRLNVVADYG